MVRATDRALCDVVGEGKGGGRRAWQTALYRQHAGGHRRVESRGGGWSDQTDGPSDVRHVRRAAGCDGQAAGGLVAAGDGVETHGGHMRRDVA